MPPLTTENDQKQESEGKFKNQKYQTEQKESETPDIQSRAQAGKRLKKYIVLNNQRQKSVHTLSKYKDIDMDLNNKELDVSIICTGNKAAALRENETSEFT